MQVRRHAFLVVSHPVGVEVVNGCSIPTYGRISKEIIDSIETVNVIRLVRHTVVEAEINFKENKFC